MEKSSSFFSLVILPIVKPIVRLMVKSRLPFHTYMDYMKWLFIEVSKEEFSPKYKKINYSKVAAAIGLSRQEVSRIISSQEPNTDDSLLSHNKMASVIHLWTNSDDYCDDKGAPLELPITGDAPSFESLIKKSCIDLTYRTLLNELIETNAVFKTDAGDLCLTNHYYLPQKNNIEKWHVLGSDTSDLLKTIVHNFEEVPEDSQEDFLQLKTYSLDFTEELKTKLRKLAKKEGVPWLQKLDKWITEETKGLAENTEDSHDDDHKKKYRAGVGIYYFEEEIK